MQPRGTGVALHNARGWSSAAPCGGGRREVAVTQWLILSATRAPASSRGLQRAQFVLHMVQQIFRITLQLAVGVERQAAAEPLRRPFVQRARVRPAASAPPRRATRAPRTHTASRRRTRCPRRLDAAATARSITSRPRRTLPARDEQRSPDARAPRGNPDRRQRLARQCDAAGDIARRMPLARLREECARRHLRVIAHALRACPMFMPIASCANRRSRAVASPLSEPPYLCPSVCICRISPCAPVVLASGGGLPCNGGPKNGFISNSCRTRKIAASTRYIAAERVAAARSSAASGTARGTAPSSATLPTATSAG